jgi:hypothetical protein
MRVSAYMAIIFALGRAVDKEIKKGSIQGFGPEMIWGDWFTNNQRDERIKASFGKPGWRYTETRLEYEDISGRPDLVTSTNALIGLGGDYPKDQLYVVEVKTVGLEDFIKLRVAKAEHRRQRDMYYNHIEKCYPELTVWGGCVLYVPKKAQGKDPFDNFRLFEQANTDEVKAANDKRIKAHKSQIKNPSSCECPSCRKEGHAA